MSNEMVRTHQVTTFSTLQEMERLAAAMARSGMFGVKTPDQALTLMAIAQAEGQHPATVARDYHIINGRPAKKAEAMQRDFLAAGGKIEWLKLTDDVVEATFSHPQGGTATISWDTERCKRAQLMDGNHVKFPRQMKRSRVVSEGVRTVWPFATSGFYVPEEVAEFDRQDTGTVHGTEDTASALNQFAGGAGGAAAPAVSQAASEPSTITAGPHDVLADNVRLDIEARNAAFTGVHNFREFVSKLSRTDRLVLGDKIGTKENPGELLKVAINADAERERHEALWQQNEAKANAARARTWAHEEPSATAETDDPETSNPLYIALPETPSDNELLAWARKISGLIKLGHEWKDIKDIYADTLERMRHLDPDFDFWLEQHIPGAWREQPEKAS